MGYLPLELGDGVIAVYNVRHRSDYWNIKAPNNFNWGTIYQISAYGMDLGQQVGQSVLFKGESIVCTLAFGRDNYTLIEGARIVTTEIPNIS